MKNLKSIIIPGILTLGSLFTACDNFENDVPPTGMSQVVVHDDTFTTKRNQGVQLNVLANDSIGGQATLQFSQPTHGTIQTGANGTVSYQPDLDFTGTDNFNYKACIGNDCAAALVTILVKNDSINTCTVQAVNDTRTIQQNKGDSLRVMLNDNLCGETAANTTISILQPPAHGNAFTTNFKQLVYGPNINFVGQDEITYKISNSKGTSTAKVIYNITSAPQNCYLIARPDSTSLTRHLGAIDTVSIPVVANDFICPNLGPVTVHFLSNGPQFGNLMLANNGLQIRVIYTTKPNAPKNITDSFQYQICQGNRCSSFTTVLVKIH